MRKGLLHTLLLFISINGFTQVGIVEKVEIYNVSRFMTSINRVSCEGFDNTFSKQKNKYVVLNTDSLKLFQDRILSLKWKKKHHEIDVRAKLKVFYSDGQITEICVNASDDIVVNGRMVKNSKEIKKMINYYWK